MRKIRVEIMGLHIQKHQKFINRNIIVKKLIYSPVELSYFLYYLVDFLFQVLLIQISNIHSYIQRGVNNFGKIIH